MHTCRNQAVCISCTCAAEMSSTSSKSRKTLGLASSTGNRWIWQSCLTSTGGHSTCAPKEPWCWCRLIMTLRPCLPWHAAWDVPPLQWACLSSGGGMVLVETIQRRWYELACSMQTWCVSRRSAFILAQHSFQVKLLTDQADVVLQWCHTPGSACVETELQTLQQCWKV